MTNVIDFKTRLGVVGDGVKLDISEVLDAAKEENLDQVVIVGTTKDNELYLAGSEGTVQTHWMLTLAKQSIVDWHNDNV